MRAHNAAGVQTYSYSGDFVRSTVSPNNNYFITVSMSSKSFIEGDWSGNKMSYSYSVEITDVDYSPNSKYFAISTKNGNVLLHNATNRNNTLIKVINPNTTNELWAVRFSDDSKHILVA